MKGLLLKDFYMMKKYCRSVLFLVIVFNIAILFGKENIFFSVYPIIISGMIPVTLLSYDASFKWNAYFIAFPYTKKQMVTAKYIIALLSVLSATVIGVVCLTAKGIAAGEGMKEIVNAAMGLLSAALIAPSLILPVVFRFGAEKGRIIYLIIVGLLCALFAVALSLTIDGVVIDFHAWFFVPISAVIFAVSWLISVKVCRFNI